MAEGAPAPAAAPLPPQNPIPAVLLWLTDNVRGGLMGPVTDAQLSKFVQELTQAFKDAPKPVAGGVARFPSSVLHDLAPGGGLCKVVRAVIEAAYPAGQRKLEFPAKKVVALLAEATSSLIADGVIMRPVVAWSSQIIASKSETDLRRIKELLALHNALFSPDGAGATHIVYPNVQPSLLAQPPEGSGHVLEGASHNANRRKVHWSFEPESTQEWVLPENILPDAAVQPARPSPPVRVALRWLEDTFRYGEWTLDLDYEVTEDGSELVRRPQPAVVKGSRKRPATVEEMDPAKRARLESEAGDANKALLADAHKAAADDAKTKKGEDVYVLPAHCAWFNMTAVHEIEKKGLPEFFDNRSQYKTPERYQQYRDFMINTYRQAPRVYLTPTACRRQLTGDACAIIRVFRFLERWGLINTHIDLGTKPSLQMNANDTVHAAVVTDNQALSAQRPAGTGAGPSLAGPDAYQPGQPRMTKEWSEEDTLLLLDAIPRFGENWEKVAEFVGTKDKEACLLHFLRLPIEDQFIQEEIAADEAAKMRTLAPVLSHSQPAQPTAQAFGDAANPIMTHIAFLSSLVPASVARAAADAARTELGKLRGDQPAPTSVEGEKTEGDAAASKEEAVKTAAAVGLAVAGARALDQIPKVEEELKATVAEMVDVQIRKIQAKMERFEQMEELLIREKEFLARQKDRLQNDRFAFLVKCNDLVKNSAAANGSAGPGQGAAMDLS